MGASARFRLLGYALPDCDTRRRRPTCGLASHSLGLILPFIHTSLLRGYEIYFSADRTQGYILRYSSHLSKYLRIIEPPRT